MKSLPEPIRLPQPLRDVRLLCRRSAEEDQARQLHEQEEAGYERGRREGEQALSEQLVRQRAELLELQNGVLDSLQQAIPRLTASCEPELISLALEVAQRLVCGLPVSVELVEGAIREALAEVEESANYTVHLHPSDLALLQQVNSPLLLPAGGVERVNFQANDTVSRGGCLVHTRFGTIDARRETKVELLKKALFS